MFGGIRLINELQYRQTYEYKLVQLSYSDKAAKFLSKKLNDKELDDLLKRKYDENIYKLANEKYFMYKNLDRYLEYINQNRKAQIETIVPLVNVNRDKVFYDDAIKTDISKKELMLVNKYHGLSEDYNPENLVKVGSRYAYEGHRIIEEVYQAFKDLADEARGEGYTIVINSSYRSFSSQNSLWQAIRSNQGTRVADQRSARAGFSEHQTGYAIDVADFYDTGNDFGKTEAYKWMIENSYKFGFILRYPKHAENITGYSYEPWHYRYIGKEMAKKVYDEGITFDEYYAFYLDR